MDYVKRLQTIRERMTSAGVDVVYLTRGANLFYLTGVRRQLEHATDHNAYGDWVAGGYIRQNGDLTLVAPRMGGSFFKEEAAGKPWINEVRLIPESRDPLSVMHQAVAGSAPGVRSIAIDDRVWA